MDPLAIKIFEIASNVSTPLALAGFLAAAFFLIVRGIVSRNIFPALTARLSSEIIKLSIICLFILSLVAMLLGFAGFIFVRVVQPPSLNAFSVTVYVHGEGDISDLVLRNNGFVWMTLGGDRKQERIGDKGQADFKEIPSSFRGREVPVWVEAEGFETVRPEEKHRIDDGALYIAVRQKAARLAGRVQDETGQVITNALVSVGPYHTNSDSNGYFDLSLPNARIKQDVEVIVTASGHNPWHERFPLGESQVSITLNRRQ
jgi:hypothetical protein